MSVKIAMGNITAQELRDALTEAAKPAVHLLYSDEQRRSKVGGAPNMPSGIAWPMWKEKPLAFIAQLDMQELSDFATVTGLPKTGSLFFFYDVESNTWGFDPLDRGSWQVIYSELAIPDFITQSPVALSSDYEFRQVTLQPKLIQSFPSSERTNLDLTGAPVSIYDSEYELRTSVFGSNPEHQIGGYPDPIQGDDMELECQLVTNGLYCGNSTGYQDPRAKQLATGTKDWRLLLQIDTDDNASMMWGDCGRLYFWIRESDLTKKDFSNVWMVLQCS